MKAPNRRESAALTASTPAAVWISPAISFRISASSASVSCSASARSSSRSALEYADWLHAVWMANRLVGSPEFRRLIVRIADELERVEVLNADDLRRIHEAAREGGA
jgi:hypothetical protein